MLKMKNELRECIKERIDLIKNTINSTILRNKNMIDNNVDDQSLVMDYISLDKDIEYVENVIKNWDYNAEFDNFKLEICENSIIKDINIKYNDYLLRLINIIKNIENIYPDDDVTFIFIERIINRVSILGWMCDNLYTSLHIITHSCNIYYCNLFKSIFNNEYNTLLCLMREDPNIQKCFERLAIIKSNVIEETFKSISCALFSAKELIDDLSKYRNHYDETINDEVLDFDVINLDKILDQLNKYCEIVLYNKDIPKEKIISFKELFVAEEELTRTSAYELFKGYVKKYDNIISMMFVKRLFIKDYMEKDITPEKTLLLTTILDYLRFINYVLSAIVID